VHVFIAGGTGYIGRPLIEALLRDGHTVRALVRPGSEKKLPSGCVAVPGNALDASSYQSQVAPADTFVHLVGVAHPGPGKGREFREVDLASIEAAVQAALFASVRHFIYVSVAHPAPVMRDYIAVRTRGEELILAADLRATILRPWYVLGPGHRWPYALLPLYRLLEALPATRESARRLGLVRHRDMVNALRDAVARPANGIAFMSVEEIRRLGRSALPA
jgi:uncharacterized protein YbjT (DUF2867 family)